MDVELLIIGDELLIGQVVDSNSAWIGKRLNEAGFRVSRTTTVGDVKTQIKAGLREALDRVDIVLLTGGLGPTRDDLTKEILCEFFDCGVTEDPKIVEDLTRFFQSRGMELSETNRRQAEVPDKCDPVYNKNGTAPGMWFEEDGKIVVSMPGVPYEMMAMMDETVIPKLSGMFRLPSIFHYTVTTIGIGESFLSDLLNDWELALPEYIRLAYLPSPGMVRLRLSCYNSNPEIEKEIRNEVRKLDKLAGKYILGYGNYSPAEIIGSLLRESNLTLAVAESCTGGYISHLITSVPGCSDYYIGSSISYANQVKTKFLGVDPTVIENQGAVSEEVAVAMASGVREKLGSDWSLATTGVAGPGGGTEVNPVGTVWIGIAGPSGAFARKYRFGTNRQRNIQNTALFAFKMLKNEVDKLSGPEKK